MNNDLMEWDMKNKILDRNSEINEPGLTPKRNIMDHFSKIKQNGKYYVHIYQFRAVEKMTNMSDGKDTNLTNQQL